jgi:hypothetical protein
VFLGDTPTIRGAGDVPDCLSQNPADIQQCGVSADDGLGAPGRDAEMKAATAAGAAVIDPGPWFCSAATCPPIIDKYVVYADASHITGTYAMVQVPALRAALDTALAAT